MSFELKLLRDTVYFTDPLTNGRMRQEEILFYYDVLLKWFKIFY